MTKENRSEFIKVRVKPSVKKKLQEIQEFQELSQGDLIEKWILEDYEWVEVSPENDDSCSECGGLDIHILTKEVYMQTLEQPAEYLQTVTCNNCGHTEDL